MLPAANRLRGERDIQQLMRRGRSVYTQVLRARIAPNRLQSTRFAFVVSQKVSKKAVVRNKLRRRLREITRHRLPEIRPGFDMLVSTKKEAPDLNFDQLKKEMDMLLDRGRLMSIVTAHAKKAS